LKVNFVMRRYILFFLITSAYSFHCFGDQSNEIMSSAIEIFEQQVIQHMEQSQIPGLAVLVTYDGQTIYSKGFGYKETENINPVTNDTLFRLSSNGKMLTAIAVLQIWEKGLIEIDEPVIKFLPWFEQNDPSDRWKKITIRQLLNHTAGLARCEGSDIFGNVPQCLSSYEMIPGALKQEMVFDPGHSLKYSNLGYWFLSQIIAEHGGSTGQTPDERYINYIKENILAPLRMNNSGFVIAERDVHQFANPYGIVDKKTGERALLPFIFNPNGLNSAWGFYSSANDLSNLLIWLNSAIHGHSAPLLKQSTMSFMTSNPIKDLNSSFQYGLGIMIREGSKGPILGHTGSFPGYMTRIMIDINTGIGIAILSNAGDEDTMKYWNLAFKTIGNALQSLPPELPLIEPSVLPSKFSYPSGKFKNIIGRYKHDLFGEYTLFETPEGSLTYEMGSKISLHLIKQLPYRLDFKLGCEGSYLGFNGETLSIFLDSEGNAEYLILGNTFRHYRIGNL
jgi:CubicO group peptidase (beta-lactamase class C family)